MGKTVVGTFVVSVRARSTLILVHRRPLLEQWIAQLAPFLGISKDEIGRIGGGKHGPNGRLDVAMIQTLVRNPKVDELVSHYGHVVIDECHHVPARSFENVLSRIRARFVTGLTATPQRRDGHHPITRMQIGPVRFTVDGKSQTAKHGFAHRLLVHETAFANPGSEVMGIQNLYAALATDEARNAAIIDDVIAALEEGRSPILLTERKDHLEFFETRLRSFARNMIVLRGGMGVKATRAAAERLAAIPANEERLILATGRFIGEGFDDARLDTLFLALPVSWKGTLVQYAGRLHRRHADKTEVRIHDYVDSRVPSLERMFQKRLRGYRSMGYERSAEPARMASPELTTVPDSEIWREES